MNDMESIVEQRVDRQSAESDPTAQARDHHQQQSAGMDMMMMMQMTFYVSSKVTCLFDFWDVSTPAGMFGTAACWFVVAFLYQGLKFFRGYVQKSCECAGNTSLVAKLLRGRGGGAGRYNSISGEQSPPGGGGGLRLGRVNWPLHLTQTVLQMIQTAVSYLIMLVVMTYNVWLYLAVLLGDGTGYLVFHRYTFDNSDHCN